MITTFWAPVGPLCSRPILYISNPTHTVTVIPIVLCCGVLIHRPHNQGTALCLYFPTKTASEMYGLCFWWWPRPKATPRPKSSAFSILTQTGEVMLGVLIEKVSAPGGKKRKKGLLGLFLDREYFTFSAFSNSLFLSSCLRDLRQIFSRGFRSR